MGLETGKVTTLERSNGNVDVDELTQYQNEFDHLQQGINTHRTTNVRKLAVVKVTYFPEVPGGSAWTIGLFHHRAWASNIPKGPFLKKVVES